MLAFAGSAMAQQKDMDEYAKIKSIIPKSPPGFLSNAEKLKIIKSPGFTKPLNVKLFSDNVSLDNTPISLSVSNMQSRGFSLGFLEPRAVWPDGVAYFKSLSGYSSLEFIIGNINVPSAVNAELYVFEVNISNYIQGILPTFDITFINASQVVQDQTITAIQSNGSSCKLFFTLLLSNSDEVNVRCVNADSWFFSNCQLTKVNQ